MRPLHFKHIFTPKLSVVVVVLFYIGSVVLYIPVFATFNYIAKFDAVLNTTKYYVSLDLAQTHVRKPIQMLMHSIIPIMTQIVTFLCVVGMVWALRRSSGFRQKSQQAAEGVEVEGGGAKLSGKERQAVKQVVLVSLVYLLCNVVKIVSFHVETFLTDYHPAPVFLLARLSNTVHCYRRMLEGLNSSVNIFIYLKYNKKFAKFFGAGEEPTK